MEKAKKIINTQRDAILTIRWDVENALYRLGDLYTSLSNSKDAKKIGELGNQIWCHLESLVQASAEYDEVDDWEDWEED